MAEPDPVPRVSQVIALLAALLAAVVLWLSRDLIAVEVGARLLLPVLWLAVWTSACIGVGWWSLRLLAGPGDRPTLVEVLAAGAAVLALTTALAATVGLLRPSLLQLVLALAAIEGGRLLWFGRKRPSLPPIAVAMAAAVLLAAAGVAMFMLLTAPPVMFDALNYHLAFPARWLAAPREGAVDGRGGRAGWRGHRRSAPWECRQRGGPACAPTSADPPPDAGDTILVGRMPLAADGRMAQRLGGTLRAPGDISGT